MKFIVCISREDGSELSTDDLTLGCLYEVVSPADSCGMIRVIDDSGEDYLYLQKFEPVEVQKKTAVRLHDLLVA